MMTVSNSAPLLRKKLLSSVLFKMYTQSFYMVTGYQLKLQECAAQEGVSIPVVLGRSLVGYLVSEESQPGIDLSVKGLLESFALQLGDEANRSLVAADAEYPQVIQDVIVYVTERLMGKITLDEAAEAVGLCPFQLCRIFKKHTGVTMTEYVNRLRVERARQRLEDPARQVSEIASEVGFSSLSQFNRNFLKFAGESPSEFRESLSKLECCQFAVV